MYFLKHKLATEIDENVHKDRNIDNEINKKAIWKELGCKFISINPDGENVDMNVEIDKIYNQIIEWTKKLTEESTKESTKRSLIDKISIQVRIRIQVRSSNKIKMFKVRCQKDIAIIIKHANLLFKL